MKTMLLFIFIGMFGAALAGDMDKRQVLKLNEQQRGLVLGEMRALLSGTQNILAALSKDDMAAVAQQARARPAAAPGRCCIRNGSRPAARP